jgi:ABC-type sugar transport system ATPase subunit
MIFAAANAIAEDLVLPYACTMTGNTVHVSPSSDNALRIVGRRDEQPFVACTKGASVCETMMVHRFAVECDGATVPWTRIAQAASVNGVALPANLPDGYAPVSTLSGGQRQSVAISRLLLSDVQLIIMDEPMAALGVDEGAKVLQLITNLAAKGISVLLISHNLEHVFGVADRIAVLKNGTLVGVVRREDSTREQITSMIVNGRGATPQTVEPRA